MPKQPFHPEIPPGSRCYGTLACRHWGYRLINGARIVWCSHLGYGSIPNDISANDLLRLEEHYGFEEFSDPLTGDTSRVVAQHPDLRGGLLWDQISECHTQAERYGDRERRNDYASLTVREPDRAGAEPRPYEVFCPVRATFNASRRTRQVLRFLARLPAALRRNCGTPDDAVISHEFAGEQMLAGLRGARTALHDRRHELYGFAALIAAEARE